MTKSSQWKRARKEVYFVHSIYTNWAVSILVANGARRYTGISLSVYANLNIRSRFGTYLLVANEHVEITINESAKHEH